jgi:transposase
MARTLSMDLRERVIAAISAGESCRRVAARFDIGIATAIRWNALARKTGSVAAQPRGGDRHSHRIEAHAELLLSTVAAQPDITLAELQALLLKERNESVAISTLWRFFNRHGLTYKKSQRTRQSKPAPTS